MPRISKFPILFDEVPHLTISTLSQKGFFNESMKGAITWYCDKTVAAEITVLSEISQSPCITLLYIYKGEERKYRIELESRKSNLGKGIHWYFICPVTKKHCRKLYCVNGFFLHREAFKGIAFYRSQTESKTWRELSKVLHRRYNREEFEKELESKYFKTYYKGEFTKRYLRVMRKMYG